jgi:hypothetical protein
MNNTDKARLIAALDEFQLTEGVDKFLMGNMISTVRKTQGYSVLRELLWRITGTAENKALTGYSLGKKFSSCEGLAFNGRTLTKGARCKKGNYWMVREATDETPINPDIDATKIIAQRGWTDFSAELSGRVVSMKVRGSVVKLTIKLEA